MTVDIEEGTIAPSDCVLSTIGTFVGAVFHGLSLPGSAALTGWDVRGYPS